MNKAGKTIILILFTTALLVSCGGQPPASPTPDVNAILTQSIGTLSASFFLTQTAMVPPATNTPLPTATSLATNTPLTLPSPLPSATLSYVGTAYIYPSVTPTGTYYTPTVNPSSLGYGCNNLVLIRDETIPSGTEIAPGADFTKTWKVSNSGTCNWMYTYRLVHVSGNKFAADSVKLNNKIEPGKWTQLSVLLTAPKEPGTYTGYWQLSDGAGHTFGSLLGVSIVVKKPAEPTAVPPTATKTPVTPSYP